MYDILCTCIIFCAQLYVATNLKESGDLSQTLFIQIHTNDQGFFITTMETLYIKNSGKINKCPMALENKIPHTSQLQGNIQQICSPLYMQRDLS